MSEPLFSAIIPTYNRAGFLPAAIESIVGQTMRDCEIIVVDDGSVDDTPAVVRSFGERVRAVRQENRGVSAARNAGIRLARGRWIVFLDSDDVWLPDYLQTHHALIQRHPEAVAILLNSTAIDVNGVPTDNFAEHQFYAALGGREELALPRGFGAVIDHHLTTLQSVAFARTALLNGRLFDEEITIAEDLDLIAEMALRGPFVFSSRSASRVIRRPGDASNLSAQFTRQELKTRRAWARVYQRFADDARLTSDERAAVARAHAATHRAIGNLHLLQANGREARSAYRRAWDLDRSPASAGRLLFSYLPLSLARLLLHKNRTAPPAGDSTTCAT